MSRTETHAVTVLFHSIILDLSCQKLATLLGGGLNVLMFL